MGFTSQDIGSFLSSKGDSINNLNTFISDSVRSAGLFTKEGVVTAGLAVINYLYYNYNIQIPYISNVQCAATRYNKYFGINPEWGVKVAEIGSEKAKECQGSHIGFDCASFVGWSIHNGGFKAHNTGGSYVACYNGGGSCAELVNLCSNLNGSVCSGLKGRDLAYSKYKEMELGDLIYSSVHIMLVLGSYDRTDGVYIYEGTSPVGIKFYTYNELYNGGYYAVVKMDNYYNEVKNHACIINGITLPDSYKDRENEFISSNCKYSD